VEVDFGHQYAYFEEEIDPHILEPLMKPLDSNVCLDANHGHDLVTGKSITRMVAFIASILVIWYLKRQGSVQMATYGAKFQTLKSGVEEAVLLRYYLRSMGVLVTKTTMVYCDNASTVLHEKNDGFTLKKNHLALLYHYCREHFARDVVDIHWIKGERNVADPFTKSMTSTPFFMHFGKLMVN